MLKQKAILFFIPLATILTGCLENGTRIQGELDREMLLYKGSGKVRRFNRGALEISLSKQDHATLIHLKQGVVEEWTSVNIPYDQFNSDEFFFAETQTGSKIALRGSRTHSTATKAVTGTRKCQCPIEISKQEWKMFLVRPKDYFWDWKETETYEKTVYGTYEASNPKAEFAITHYSLDVMSGGNVSAHFTGQTEELTSKLNQGSCQIMTPDPLEYSHHRLLLTTRYRDVYTKTIAEECQFY